MDWRGAPFKLLPMDHREQIAELLEMLASENLADRLTAIEILGEIGDAKALAALRAQMRPLHEEYYALVVAVGKLKKRLGVK
jgi:HEAT repeat protein